MRGKGRRFAIVAWCPALALAACLDRAAPRATNDEAVEPDAVQPAGPAGGDGLEAAPPQPVEPEPEPEPAPEPAQKPPAAAVPTEPTVDSEREHVVVVGARDLEDVVVLPDGAAFTTGGEIWTIAADGSNLKKRVTTVDPHGLATDGTRLYWLGHERNGTLELGSDEVEFLPRIGQPGTQHRLAFGDVLYGLTFEGALWRFAGGGVTRVHTRLEPGSRTLSGFAAGKRVVVLAALRREGGRMSPTLWRVRVGGKGHAIATGAARSGRRWSVNPRGDVLLAEGGVVKRRDLSAKSSRKLFDEPGVGAVCWCGPHVCTFVPEANEVRLHRRGAAEASTLATDMGELRRVSCNARHVAWTTAGDELPSELHLASIE